MPVAVVAHLVLPLASKDAHEALLGHIREPVEPDANQCHRDSGNRQSETHRDDRPKRSSAHESAKAGEHHQRLTPLAVSLLTSLAPPLLLVPVRPIVDPVEHGLVVLLDLPKLLLNLWR
jgi:hypothetical protein